MQITNMWNIINIFALTDIVRQDNSSWFAERLPRLRIGDHTTETIEKLKQAQVKFKRDDPRCPSNLLHLFTEHVYADKYNQYMLSRLQSVAYKSTPRLKLTNNASTSLKIGVKTLKKCFQFSKESFHSQSGSSCNVQ